MSTSTLDQNLTYALYREDEEIASLLIETTQYSENHYPDEDEEYECRLLYWESNDESDWESHMGCGYWDDNGGSSECVPTKSRSISDSNENYETEGYWTYYDESLSDEEYRKQANLELTWNQMETENIDDTM